METVVITIIVFLLVILVLVSMLLFAKAKLSPSGKITININGGERIIEVNGGDTEVVKYVESKINSTDVQSEVYSADSDDVNYFASNII